MRARRRVAASLVSGLAVAAMGPGPGHAATQTVEASLGSSISMTTAPDATIDNWALAIGTNNRSGGSMTIQANTPYVVTVSAQKDRLSEWDPSAGSGAGAYVAGGKALASPLIVTPTATGGTAGLLGSAVALSAPGVSASGTTMITGTGLTTDTFSLSLGQLVLVGDPPLQGGRLYRNVLTYTASAPI